MAGSIGDVRERWLSKRAVSLHAALLVGVPGCALAAWWQVHRAQDGNDLSYLYSVMWPLFGLLTLYFWWMLIHTDYEDVGLKGMRRRAAAAAGQTTTGRATDGSPVATEDVTAPTATAMVAPGAGGVGEDEDPELAAYNARLAELASRGAKTWRNRDPVVVRHSP